MKTPFPTCATGLFATLVTFSAHPALALSRTAEAPARTAAQNPPQSDSSPRGAAKDSAQGRWSLAATWFAGPFEEFPGSGLALGALLQLKPRFGVGARGTFYAPRTYANVHRNALSLEGLVQGTLVDTSFLDWYGTVGFGVGVFHDDYLRVYEDVTRYVPGISVATGAELKTTEFVRLFAGVGARAYFTDELTDSQWLELNGGARFVF